MKTLRAIGPPLGAWLLATAVVLVSPERAGFRPFRPETWIHWDANLYLSIAREGRTLYHCAASTGETGWRGHGFDLHNIQYTETAVLLITAACVLVELIVHRRTVSRTELLVAVWAATTWLLASIPADRSQYREQAVLVPLAVLVRRLPPPLLSASSWLRRPRLPCL